MQKKKVPIRKKRSDAKSKAKNTITSKKKKVAIRKKKSLTSIRREMEQKIRELAEAYSTKLDQQIKKRTKDMDDDDTSHFLIYGVLGIAKKEGELIDLYQNKGRFLYKYAGSFLEEAVILCFEHKFPRAQRKMKTPNTIGARPKTFEIDCLIGSRAYEIKWRDATTDGDHITKEHTRIKVIKAAGFTPIRLMFYYPNRDQARKIQEAIKTLYAGVGGEFIYEKDAWDYIEKKTDINLLGILEKIARERTVGKK